MKQKHIHNMRARHRRWKKYGSEITDLKYYPSQPISKLTGRALIATFVRHDFRDECDWPLDKQCNKRYDTKRGSYKHKLWQLNGKYTFTSEDFDVRYWADELEHIHWPFPPLVHEVFSMIKAAQRKGNVGRVTKLIKFRIVQLWKCVHVFYIRYHNKRERPCKSNKTKSLVKKIYNKKGQ